MLGAPPVSPPEHDYESLLSNPGSGCSQMQTLDVRIKVTRAVMRESGQFDNDGSDGGSDRAEKGCSVYDNITVRDGQQEDDSWQYTTRVPQVNISDSPWRAKILKLRNKVKFRVKTGEENFHWFIFGISDKWKLCDARDCISRITPIFEGESTLNLFLLS